MIIKSYFDVNEIFEPKDNNYLINSFLQSKKCDLGFEYRTLINDLFFL